MNKRIHNVILQSGTDESAFLANEAAGMEVINNFDLFDGMICMRLTDDEAATLNAVDFVLECLPERTAIDLSYPTTTPRFESGTVTYRTRKTPGSAYNGADQTGLNMFFTSEFNPDDGTQPFGYFQGTEYRFNDTVQSNFLGDYVDIVAIEAGTPDPNNAGHEDHPDFSEFADENTSRFVPMDWSTVSSVLSSERNNQVTNSNQNWFSSHAIGVLSAAGGKHCGWGKNSSLRLVYTNPDGIANAYEGVLLWHRDKPVNPVTGVRNATVVTGAWGYASVAHLKFYRCEQINSLEVYDEAGNQSTINRPAGGWGSDLTPFTNNLFVPRVVRDPVNNRDYWMISIPDQTRSSFFDNIMNLYDTFKEIYHFKSAGNNAQVAVNPNDPRWNNKVYIDAGANGVINTLNDEYKNVFTPEVSYSGLEYYPLRAEVEGGDNQFTIAACQQDDVNRLMDDYSARGPMIDFASYGDFTWTSNPKGTYADGKWGYSGGTSTAAPVAAGCAVVFLDWYFTQRGVYPSIAELKSLMIKHAKSNLIGEDLINFNNIPTAGDILSTKLYNSSEVNRVKNYDYINGGAELSELYGTPPLRVHIPWGVRMGSGKYIAGGSEQTSEGRRPTSGRAWPRPKVSFTS